MITKIEELSTIPKECRAKVHYRNGLVASRRLIVRDDSFAIYAKGSRTRGTWYYGFNSEISAIEPIVENVQSDEVKWKKSWQKALKMLNESGLWEDLKCEIETALSIGYDTINKAYQVYWEDNVDESERIKKIKAIEPRLISKHEDREYVNTFILWYMNNPAKIKKMYFGKNYSEHYLGQIAESMQKKESYSTSARAGYDVSFEYNAEKNKAFYSEEFRGCGNGHYYLALNSTHALFHEDD